MRTSQFFGLLAATLPLVSAQDIAQCTTNFLPITAAAAVAGLNPGWNLGNTLDAVPDEGSWNNAPATPETLAEIKSRGFKAIRIPVTWAYHFSSSSPDWTVNTTFLNRVETVVDQALALNFTVVLNVHHDSWIWADPTVSNANTTMILEKFTSLWTQIGTKFACKSSSLIFEAINEPVGTTQEHGDLLNNMNSAFLDSINKAGGHNPKRVVSLSGLGQDILKTTQFFKKPTTYLTQPWALQFHYYSPYDFIFSAWGKTIWGSDTDKSSLIADFQLLHGNFTDIPTFVGEWDASTSSTETAARWKYNDFFIRTCRKYGYSSIIWDNGDDQYNRTARFWKDPVGIDILFSATLGRENALPDSTTDPSSATQNSSAFLWHKVGEAVGDVQIPYLLNGNTLLKITDKERELSKEEYSMSTTGILTISKSYLSTILSPSTPAGLVGTLTLTFTPAVPITLQIIQFDTPFFPHSNSSNSTTNPQNLTIPLSTLQPATDLHIPITYQGLPRIAALKAIRHDGTYLVDDWTRYLGPLQQGRWTMGEWGFGGEGLVLWAAGVERVRA